MVCGLRPTAVRKHYMYECADAATHECAKKKPCVLRQGNPYIIGGQWCTHHLILFSDQAHRFWIPPDALDTLLLLLGGADALQT